MKKKPKIETRTNDAGRELLEGVRQMHEAVTTGNIRRFKVSRVSVPEPGDYPPEAIKRLRESVGITQPMLATILGVSTEAVEHWEQGLRRPAATARRLMDQIRQRPDDFLEWLLRNRSGRIQPDRPKSELMSKTRARALLRMAAKVLTREEMTQAVQDTYLGRAGSKR